jgi:hypothetical protein
MWKNQANDDFIDIIQNAGTTLDIPMKSGVRGVKTGARTYALYVDEGSNTLVEPISAWSVFATGVFDATVAAGITPSSYNIGDLVQIGPNGGTTRVHQVMQVHPTFVRFDLAEAVSFTPGAGDEVTRLEVPCVQFYDPAFISQNKQTVILAFPTEYTIGVDSNGIKTITLDANFENNYPYRLAAPGATGYAGPPSDDSYLICRGYPGTSTNHSDIIKEIVEESGLSTDTASFATASSTAIDFRLSYPFKNEFSTLKTLLGKLLQSSFGILSITNNLDIAYYLIDSPSAGGEVTNDDVIIDSIYSSFDGKDIYSDITIKNENNHIIETQIPSGLPSGYYLLDTLRDRNTIDLATIKSKRGMYLNESNKLIEVDVMLESIPASLQSRLESFYGERRGAYKFKTKGPNFSTILNDDITITSNKLAPQGSKNIKAISISKTDKETIITGNDLINI